MGTEKGIFRRLLPGVSKDAPKVKQEIQKRNLLVLKIDSENRLFCNDSLMNISELKDVAVNFISNPDNNDYLPERQEKEIPFLGKMPVTSNHIISLQVSREAGYNTYVSVQNELQAAYNHLRNEISKNRFRKIYAALGSEHQSAVREIYPQRIIESEIPGEKENPVKENEEVLK
ncbi:biopolymer transporter ExbD [Bacteroidia bacterium]|nr:biopolymer transporter ExbD [Bacteroidia bacterium]